MSARELSGRALDVLAAVGRDAHALAFENEGERVGVAIRWVPVPVPPSGERWITKFAETRDDAACAAASEFSKRLREEGEKLLAWAGRIDAAVAACRKP